MFPVQEVQILMPTLGLKQQYPDQEVFAILVLLRIFPKRNQAAVILIGCKAAPPKSSPKGRTLNYYIKPMSFERREKSSEPCIANMQGAKRFLSTFEMT